MSVKPYIELRKEAICDRTYRGRSHYSDEAAWYVSQMSQRYPDTNWREYANITAETAGCHYDIKVKHMIRWGRSDARIIEDAFQVKLPDSVHEFYSQITEAVFLWRKIFHFLPPDDVVAWERECRQLTECEELPVHLIRFCKTDADSLALRFNFRTGNWNIVFAAYYDSTEEIQSPSSDNTYIAETLDQLLDLLLRQDGLIYLEEMCHMQKVLETAKTG